ncbi:MAG TPA: hypothetical protein PL075_02595 [Candidatus Paceibacterota bacterium]|nr:hypothetical protein [Candidatus Paceibacterota bacterium]
MKTKIVIIFLIVSLIGVELLPVFVDKASAQEVPLLPLPSPSSLKLPDMSQMEPVIANDSEAFNLSWDEVLLCSSGLSGTIFSLLGELKQIILNPVCQALGREASFLGIGGTVISGMCTINVGGSDQIQFCKDWLQKKKATIKARAAETAKILLGYAAKTFMDHLVYSTVDWISGRTTGEPQFVTNWQAFFNDVADEAFGRFIENSPFSELCEPFRFQVRATTRLPGRPPFPTCTLTQVLSNLEYFYSDFSNGGWLVFEQSFYPWNTADGAWLMTQEALEYELAQAQMEAEKKTQTGYQPIEDCVHKIKNYITGDTECWDSIISAPSQTVSDVASKAVTAQIDKTESYFLTSADLSNYATMIGQALITRLIKSAKEELIGGKWYGKGLLDLPEKGDEGPSLNLRYSCKNYDGMGSCEYDANGSYTSLESCQAACSKNQYRWGCNTETGICEYQASGPYTDFTTCSNACSESTSTPTTTSMFWTCDSSTGECVEDENGDFRSLQGCLKMCNYKEPGQEVPSY